MTILALHATRNSFLRRDATHAFIPEAQKFAAIHGAALVGVDNKADQAARRDAVCSAIERHRPKTIAMFCHGWSSGIQFGFRMAHVRRLASDIRFFCPDDAPTVVLYACSTALGLNRSAPGGDGGFADVLRDNLCRAGARNCRVFAHSTAGHCTANPYVRVFDGMGRESGGIGGTYLVAPKSPQWKAWKCTLRTDERFMFPFRAELHP